MMKTGSKPQGPMAGTRARLTGGKPTVLQKSHPRSRGVYQKLGHSQLRRSSPPGSGVSVQDPPQTSKESSTKERKDAEQVDFRQQWYAVHVVESLPEDRPWPITILGRDLVIWKDGEGEWRAFDDLCPHRKVALSEGRLEDDGTLACAYHGWRFDGEGKCTDIPQLDDDTKGRRLRAAAPACATFFPTAVKDGLLFVWMVPGADGLLQSSSVPVPHDPETEGKAIYEMPWYARRMPLSWEMLMENLTDPSHFPFAHHGVANADRSKPEVPPYDMVERKGKQGYRVGASFARKNNFGRMRRDTSDVSWFPSMHTLDSREPIPGLERNETFDSDPLALRLRFFCTPSTETSSLLIFRSEMYGEKFKKIAKTAAKVPVWVSHTLRNSPIFDGDMVFLNRQSVMMATGQLRGLKDYYMPAACDLGTRELWRHLSVHCKNGINYYPHSPNTEILPPEVLLDRYSQHVAHSKASKGAYDNIKKAETAVAVAAIASAVVSVVFFAVGSFLRSGVAGLVAVAAAVGLSKLRQLLRKFTYEPYVHAEKN